MRRNNLQSNELQAVGTAAKAGALFLALWGVLHVWVGYEGTHQYLSSGAKGLWNLMIGGSSAPRKAFQHASDALTANAHSHVLFNLCMDIGGYGVLGLILALVIYKKGSWMAYFIALVAIGICDLTFLFASVMSGISELGLATISGPVLWFIAMALIPFGLPKLSKNNILSL
ncbi:MAG: hypothetical protein ACOYMF_16905 [Bacteroidales bacterium]